MACARSRHVPGSVRGCRWRLRAAARRLRCGRGDAARSPVRRSCTGADRSTTAALERTSSRTAADRHRRAAVLSLADDTDKPLTLVFFGYTHCPDICRLVMANARLRDDPARRRAARAARRRVRDHRPGARRRGDAARPTLDRVRPRLHRSHRDLAADQSASATPWASPSSRARSCPAAATRSTTAHRWSAIDARRPRPGRVDAGRQPGRPRRRHADLLLDED